MHKTLAMLMLFCVANPAFAQDCPPKYRFVDFGSKGVDGVMRRGGTIFRAFDGSGAFLLRNERTVCRAVEETSRDGRALPIPVVSRIDIDPAIAGMEVIDLRLAEIEDVVAASEANAERHRDRLNQTDAIIARAQTFLCASTNQADAVSCQLLSPYEGNAALVVYCLGQRCEMPVMVRDTQLAIGAVWHRNAMDPETLGQEISDKIQRIHDFFEEQI